MSLLRASLTLLTTYSMVSNTFTPRHPPITGDERKAYRSPEVKLGRLIILWTHINGSVCWIITLNDVAANLAVAFPHPWTKHVYETFAASLPERASVTLNSTFLLGISLALLGSYIRYQCLETLGRHFTYQLSIRKEHQLVTSGPYSVVRHPSYTGAIIALIGFHTYTFGPGSFLWESDMLATNTGKLIMALAVISNILILMLFVSRTVFEDKALRTHFEKQWDRWAQSVRYRLIPYVF